MCSREDSENDAAVNLFVNSKKERLNDVRYQEFRGVSPDCVERLKLQSGLTSFLCCFIEIIDAAILLMRLFLLLSGKSPE